MSKTYTAARARRLIMNRELPADAEVTGDLDLSGCDLSGVTLPTTIGGWLYLSGCDLSGVTLPTTIGGGLDLRGCDLSGVTLPTTIGGGLYLSGCDLSGVTLPTTIGGGLDLSGCDLSGVTLPTTIGGGLDLSGCDLSGVTNWFTINGEATRRRCIAVSDYALIQTETGQYSAGCRGPWTRDQALSHWRRSTRKDERAKAFAAAIEAHPVSAGKELA